MEKVYEKKVYVKAFQFDGNAIDFENNKDIPLWAINAYKDGDIKKRSTKILYIDHKEHADFVKEGDYIIQSEFGRIFSLPKAEFEKIYTIKRDWIPCSERLPEPARRYLATVVWADGDCIVIKEVHNVLYGIDLRWHTDGIYEFEKPLDCKVTAWKPTPIPYEVEEHGQVD